MGFIGKMGATMNKSVLTAVVLGITLSIGSAGVARSTFSDETGSAERIQSAEYLRIYSQEVAAAACFLYNDIEASVSAALLMETIEGFDLHIDALLNGNTTLGIIGGEERRKTIVELEATRETWTPISEAAKSLLDDPRDTEAVTIIKSENSTLFEMTDLLVSNLESEYSNPTEIIQADVLAIEIVGRQAMMSQKIAKYACQVYSGDASQEVLSGLDESIGIYEASLSALIEGMPEVGIRPAPTPEIEAALLLVQADWSETRPALEALLSGNTLSRTQLVELYRHLVTEMYELEQIGEAYVRYSKR